MTTFRSKNENWFLSIFLSIFTETDESQRNDPFYEIKKDSQRRLTLVKVLQKDQTHIIDSWHMQIQGQNSSITKVIDYICTLPEI